METYGIIETINDEPGSAGNTNRVLTTTSRMSCKGAKLNYSINCNPLEATGVLGFTELLDELERIATLQGTPRTQALQELSQRKGCTVARLCHIIARMDEARRTGGAA